MNRLTLPAKLSTLSLQSEISEGAQANIYKSTIDSQEVAVKVFHSHQAKQSKNEFECLSKLTDCRHVVKVLSYLPNANLDEATRQREQMSCITTELCRQDLFYVIEKFGALTDKQLLKGLFLQILEAVEATHKAGICHLDIKLENILVAQDYTVKLCDFGLAKSIDEHMNFEIGTTGYMAPEIASLSLDYFTGAPADVFSMGVVLYILEVGSPPFGRTDDRFYRLIANNP